MALWIFTLPKHAQESDKLAHRFTMTTGSIALDDELLREAQQLSGI